LKQPGVLGPEARFGMVPIAAKFFARRARDQLWPLLAGIGWPDHPAAEHEELAVAADFCATLLA
jgi:hypothetical protein